MTVLYSKNYKELCDSVSSCEVAGHMVKKSIGRIAGKHADQYRCEERAEAVRFVVAGEESQTCLGQAKQQTALVRVRFGRRCNCGLILSVLLDRLWLRSELRWNELWLLLPCSVLRVADAAINVAVVCVGNRLSIESVCRIRRKRFLLLYCLVPTEYADGIADAATENHNRNRQQ